MIVLDLINKDFAKNDKWPLLFVIAEIVVEESNRTNPINNIKIVEIAKEKYGLDIERRTVAQYKKILEHYFGFVFKNKGHGYYVYKMPQTHIEEKQIDGIEYYNSKGFDTVDKRIEMCNKAIKNEKYLLYRCPEYIFKTLKVGKKTIKLLPIRVICFNNKYFLFSYAIQFQEYFYVNMDRYDLKYTYESFSGFKKKKELFNFKGYFKEAYDIVTGRIGIIDKITIEYREGYDEYKSLFVYKKRSFFPEVIVSLKEKYGDDVWGYEHSYDIEDVDQEGAEYDDEFLNILVPHFDK